MTQQPDVTQLLAPACWVVVQLEGVDDTTSRFHCANCGSLHTFELIRGVPSAFPVVVPPFRCSACGCQINVRVVGLLPTPQGEAMAMNIPEARDVVHSLEQALDAPAAKPKVRMVHTPMGAAPATWSASPEPERRGLLVRLAVWLFGA